MKEFNVICYNFNSKEFVPYDVIYPLVLQYKQAKVKPETFEEFRKFVYDKSLYQWKSRCEYEIILSPWPYTRSPSERYDKEKENDVEAWKDHWKKHLKECEKIDIHYQVQLNIDTITKLLMESL